MDIPLFFYNDRSLIKVPDSLFGRDLLGVSLMLKHSTLDIKALKLMEKYSGYGF